MFGHWVVRVSVFQGYYERVLQKGARPLPLDIEDAQEVLKLKGVYLLKEVAWFFPISQQKTIMIARREPQAHRLMGVWKDEIEQKWVVEMTAFAHWLLSNGSSTPMLPAR